MSGQYRINPLEPKVWDVGGEGESEPDAPLAFRQKTRLSQHISFLKDFFRSYKDFADRHIDTIELMLERLYRSFGLNDHTDFSTLTPTDYPILSDLYDVIEDAYQHYDREETRYTPKNCCGRSCWASTPCAGGRRASSSTGRQISPASVSWSSA